MGPVEMTDVEKLELLDLLIGGETPPVMVGQVANMEAAPYGVAVARREGGVTVTAVPARCEFLLKKYVGAGE